MPPLASTMQFILSRNLHGFMPPFVSLIPFIPRVICSRASPSNNNLKCSKMFTFGSLYSIATTPDLLWGSIEENGQWNGYVYELTQNNFDFAISDCFVSYLRDQVSDGSITFGSDYLAFATPRPSLT